MLRVACGAVRMHGRYLRSSPRQGGLAGIKSIYFLECYAKKQIFADRAEIPIDSMFTGEEFMEQWKQFGAMFQAIVSYRRAVSSST